MARQVRVGSDSSWEFAKRQNTGVCLEAYSLLKIGLIVVLREAPQFWAARFNHPGTARAGDGQWGRGVREISHDFKCLGTPAVFQAAK